MLACRVVNWVVTTSDSVDTDEIGFGKSSVQLADAMDAEIENFERFGTFEMNVPEDTLETWDPHKRRATEVVDMMWVLHAPPAVPASASQALPPTRDQHDCKWSTWV